MHPLLPKTVMLRHKFIHVFSVGSIFFALLFVSANTTKAQTLNTGDFAVIGFNTSFNINTTAPIGPDEFAILALASIPSGAVIKITDRGWNGSAMITTNTGDGVMSWTTTATIPAGTVFKITVTAGTTPSLTITPSTYGTPAITVGWTSTSIPGANANVGDQVIIYQGSDTNPSNFVYGFNTSNSTITAAGNWQIGSTSARDSDLPPGLTNNAALDGSVAATAVAFTNNAAGYFANNFVYSGTRTGIKANLLAAIAKRANWTYTTTLTTTYDLNIGGTFFPGSNPVFTLGVLAVNQLSFSGTTTASCNVLEWRNKGENDLFQYIIETSTDGRSFTAIDSVRATGAADYIFGVPGPLLQRSYYRLKMEDRDGSFTYSNSILLLLKDNSIQLQAYPNPVTDVLNISGPGKILRIAVADINGRQVYDVNGNGTLIQKINVQHLPQGTYLVTVKTTTDSNTFKVVKQ
ncbi:T9SS type A sorting domain-containing protein [Ferruginibacter sp. SUN106]|uniref:T9SS type A sorting domain-containing protein n=1 Tax=Ferruginibacter sp. SUN106 TaxID=2978348 RepID=UPI003D36190B